MRGAARIAASACIAAGIAGAAVASAGAQPGPSPYPDRAEEWPGSGVTRAFGWMKDKREGFWRERARKQGSIVFAGDSLTESWKTLDADFPQAQVANRGIGGDVSRGLLFRFEEDVLALNPKAIVVLIGTNDLTAGQAAVDTLANIRLMLKLAHARQPLAPVLLCTVPPSRNPDAPVDEQQRRVLNDGLRHLADRDKRVLVVDVDAALSASDGSPDSRYFSADRLHLSSAGHARWKQVLRPALTRAGAL